jgi:predicted metal-dependent phosphoesterase TrpH
MHTEHSYDCTNRVDDVLSTARARGLAGIAITDHECFDGAREAARKAVHHGLLVIPAMEVATEEGDVIGLFLRAPIESRRFAEVTDEIRAQGGVVYYPHPFKRRREVPDHVVERIDLLEVWNARGEAPGNPACNARAEALAARAGLARGAGSDAHFLWEIGRGAVELGEVHNLADVRARLLETGEREISRCETSLWAEVGSQFLKARKTGRREVWASAFRRFGRTLRWCTWDRARLAAREKLPWLRTLAQAARRLLGRATP